MNAWLLAALLTAALVVGFAAGWWTMSRLGIRSPNAWSTTLILLAGSVGGPAATYHFVGPSPTSYVLAVLIAGFPAGATFWPMAMRQGEREWL